MRSYFRFALVMWLITSYPRAAKVLVILAALATLVAMYASAVKR